MSHTIIFIALAIVILGAIAVVFFALILKARKELLDKREVALAERLESFSKASDALIADQKTFENRVKLFKPLLDGTATELYASYTVTDSDTNKYNSDTAIKNVARNRIAHNIAFDLIRQFPEPQTERVEGGRLKYFYKFKVVEGK